MVALCSVTPIEPCDITKQALYPYLMAEQAFHSFEKRVENDQISLLCADNASVLQYNFTLVSMSNIDKLNGKITSGKQLLVPAHII